MAEYKEERTTVPALRIDEDAQERGKGSRSFCSCWCLGPVRDVATVRETPGRHRLRILSFKRPAHFKRKLLSSCSLPQFPYKMTFVPPFMWQPEEEREVRDCVCVCACVRVLEFKPGEVQHVRHKEGR